MNPAESASLARALDPKSLERREVEPLLKTDSRPKKANGGLRRKALNKGTRPRQEWSSDEDYTLAREIVRRRSKGVCEHCHDAPATNCHHKAGRGFAGCHHPMLLIDLCGTGGNLDGCHGLAHQVSVATGSALGLRLPWGTTADDLAGA